MPRLRNVESISDSGDDSSGPEEAVAVSKLEGRKDDTGKIRMDLLDPYAIETLAQVLTFGAKKYAAWNWASGIPYSRITAALLRHTFAFLKGEDNDPESGLPHIAHAMCCCMFILGLSQRKPESDDRGTN